LNKYEESDKQILLETYMKSNHYKQYALKEIESETTSKTTFETTSKTNSDTNFEINFKTYTESDGTSTSDTFERI
jgi:hypothetical protein